MRPPPTLPLADVPVGLHATTCRAARDFWRTHVGNVFWPEFWYVPEGAPAPAEGSPLARPTGRRSAGARNSVRLLLGLFARQFIQCTPELCRHDLAEFRLIVFPIRENVFGPLRVCVAGMVFKQPM